MEYIFNGLKEAFGIIFSFNGEFLNIVLVSLKVSFFSTSLAALLGVPFGILIEQGKIPGKNILTTILNTLMSIPTVVVGLLVYSFLSRKGPLGEFSLLYTLPAMVIGQVILIFPIICGLTISAVKNLDGRIMNTIISFGADNLQALWIFVKEARFAVMACVMAGFARAFSEVGISMMLGGNIKNYTRTITTAIALETSKGEFSLGIALGLVLLAVALGINIVFQKINK